MPPQRQFLSPAPCRLTALRHWCWEPWHSLQRMLPHCSHTLYKHTGRDSLCLQFSSLKPFSFRAFSIPGTCSEWDLGFFPLFLFVLTHLHAGLHKPVTLCFPTPCKGLCFEICWSSTPFTSLSPDTTHGCAWAKLSSDMKTAYYMREKK